MKVGYEVKTMFIAAHCWGAITIFSVQYSAAFIAAGTESDVVLSNGGTICLKTNKQITDGIKNFSFQISL